MAFGDQNAGEMAKSSREMGMDMHCRAADALDFPPLSFHAHPRRSWLLHLNRLKQSKARDTVLCTWLRYQ